MKFSQPVKIGNIGFPTQAPFSGFIIEGESYNSGTPHLEDAKYFRNGVAKKSYIKGIAKFGKGIDALCCDYDFKAKDFAKAIKFGGEKNYILTRSGSDKDILKIDNNNGIAMYVIYREYCTSHLNIIGRRRDGKWVNFIDSKKISDMYFDGKDSYKLDGGVIYKKPKCKGDTIIIPYCHWYWKGISEIEGEIRLKWDEKAQWFGIDKVTY